MAASIVGKDRTALVVDDVIEMRAILIHMLRTLGFVDIKEAGSGKSAMRMLEDDNGFDLMILDQKMADMDGLSVVPTKRASSPPWNWESPVSWPSPYPAFNSKRKSPPAWQRQRRSRAEQRDAR
jgi:CheY-like chemotaxis protein